MSNPRITLIVSDLHVGGGPTDPGDDHIYQGNQLVHFLDQQASTPEGEAGSLELIFNGDFLEFAQTNTKAFNYVSDNYWCTSSESLAKLNTIIAGHFDVFAALKRFQASGNLVTIAAGNHDVDLAWPAVQERLREVGGPDICFEIGQKWTERYGGLLQIGHGHMHDAANRFKFWDDPIIKSKTGVPCLEMCPGTMFMVKFVNRLEEKYPFADNLLPVSKLFSVLLRDDKAGFSSVAWLFLKFAGTSSLTSLGVTTQPDIEKRLLDRAHNNTGFYDDVAAALEASGETEALQEWLKPPINVATLQVAMLALLGHIDDAAWQKLFDARLPGVLGDKHGVTLNALRKAAFEDGKKNLRVVARDRASDTGARVVVLGHTHQPDEALLKDGALYFNPGCWTRYLELAPGQNVTLDDLRDESRYPYQLNYIRVEPPRDDGSLTASKIIVEENVP